MSERFYGLEEADKSGYMKGLRDAQNVLRQEAMGKNHTINCFSQHIGKLLQEMIDRQLPPQPKQEIFNESDY